MQGRFNEFAEALDSNIQYQNMLAQTTGMSVEAQIAATNQLMKTPGALARQMDLITNPTATRNLVRFANTVAAIGASDLAEGFISGVGIPTPGNEIEAALKPQTTALLAMRANMEAQGASQAEIRRMDERIAETYARESQGVMQQLGRFAPFLGSEFAFLQRDVNQQRATMLGQAVNPNFVSDQRVDALNAITARLDNEVITRLAGIQVDFANTAEALRLTAAAGINSEAFEAAAGAMENLTNVVDGLSTGLSNISIGQANIDTLTAVVTGTVQMIQEGKDVAELSEAQEQRFLELAPQMLERIQNNALETIGLDPAFDELSLSLTGKKNLRQVMTNRLNQMTPAAQNGVYYTAIFLASDTSSAKELIDLIIKSGLNTIKGKSLEDSDLEAMTPDEEPAATQAEEPTPAEEPEPEEEQAEIPEEEAEYSIVDDEAFVKNSFIYGIMNNETYSGKSQLFKKDFKVFLNLIAPYIRQFQDDLIKEGKKKSQKKNAPKGTEQKLSGVGSVSFLKTPTSSGKLLRQAYKSMSPNDKESIDRFVNSLPVKPQDLAKLFKDMVLNAQIKRTRKQQEEPNETE